MLIKTINGYGIYEKGVYDRSKRIAFFVKKSDAERHIKKKSKLSFETHVIRKDKDSYKIWKENVTT